MDVGQWLLSYEGSSTGVHSVFASSSELRKSQSPPTRRPIHLLGRGTVSLPPLVPSGCRQGLGPRTGPLETTGPPGLRGTDGGSHRGPPRLNIDPVGSRRQHPSFTEDTTRQVPRSLQDRPTGLNLRLPVGLSCLWVREVEGLRPSASGHPSR